jgi:lipoprotein-anchoring transpeptidase ErfK/SrfK
MSTVGRRLPPSLFAGPLALVVVVLGGMYFYDHARREQIADGVKIGGVPVGGLSAKAARAKIQREAIARLQRPVTVRYGEHTWHLSARAAGLAIDAESLVAQALAASREGSILARTWRGLFGGKVNRDIPLHATYSRQAVRELDARVTAALDRPARDASVEPSAGGLREVAQHDGLSVQNGLLAGRVARALTSALASGSVTVPVRAVRPSVTLPQLAAKYPAYIVVDRSAFTLRFYAHLKLASSYPIAVGMQGLETPPGLYAIQWKQVDPPWYVPNSAWAGALAGKTIPPGPEDPLKARFMAFNGGAGIHGIDPSEYGTIGHDASHGCVRMRIPDVIALYARTPVGTPVYVA